MTAEKTFDVNRDGQVACQAFLESICDNPKPQIILDEIVSNIVRCSGATFFTVAYADCENGGMKMTFTDNGQPFDPTAEAPAPDLSASPQEREIGGLGIFMVKKMSKSVEYRRSGDLNVLTITL